MTFYGPYVALLRKFLRWMYPTTPRALQKKKEKKEEKKGSTNMRNHLKEETIYFHAAWYPTFNKCA